MMLVKKPFTSEEADAFVAKHKLGFLDICALLVAVSKSFGPREAIRWDDTKNGRCILSIKPTER